MFRTRSLAAVCLVALSTVPLPCRAAAQDATRGEGGGACTLSLSPSVLGAVAAGETLDLTVTASSMYGCDWTATSNAAWIHLDPSSGYGSGTVHVTVDPYRTGTECSDRSGRITVGNTSVLVYQGSPIAASCGTRGPVGGAIECCSIVATKAASGDLASLDVARRYRDEVLERTPSGRELVRLYYEHTGEVVRMMALDPWMTFRAARLLEHHKGTLEAAVAGTATIMPAELDEIDALLEELELAAAPGLARALGEFRRELRSPEIQMTCGIAVRARAAARAVDATDPVETAASAPYVGIAPGGNRASAAALLVPDMLAVRARGAAMAKLVDRHAAEIRSLVASDPLLGLRLASAYGAVTPVLRDLARTGSAPLPAEARAAVDGALGALADRASPALARDIARARRDLGSPRLLAGLGIRSGASAAGAADAAPLAFVGARRGSDFVARGPGYGVAVSPDALRVAISRPAGAGAVRIAFAGARRDADLVAESSLCTRVSDLTGSDAAMWRRAVPAFARVVARDVYPGIDAVYRGTQRTLDVDLVVAPEADPSRVRLRADGGALVADDGGLSIGAADGAVSLSAPVAYQLVAGARRPVAARYRMTGDGEAGIAVGAYDRTRPLVLGSALELASSFGGDGEDGGTDVALDSAGNIYVTGFANGAALDPSGGAQPAYGGGTGDAFVMKLDPTGTTVVYATYLGGRGEDFAGAVAVDAAGAAYVCGATASSNFPRVGGLQQGLRGAYDAFVAVLDPTGSSLTFSTLVGGTGLDAASGVAVDGAGRVTVCGATLSDDFPTTVGAYSRTGRGRTDAFVVKIDPVARALVYSTRLGGLNHDGAADVAVDGAGNAVVVGATSSFDFPAPGGAHPLFGGLVDGFVARVASDGSSLLSATFLGGDELDGCSGVAIDASGAVYVTGATSSINLPVVGALQPDYGGGALDALVAKLAPDLGTVVYATYLGGSDDDRGYRIAVDGSGRAVVAGITASEDFPTVDAVQGALSAGSFDAFAASVDATGARLVSATYLGGSGEEAGFGVAVDPAGDAVVVGETSSADFPGSGTFAGAYDVFLVRLAAGPAVPPPVVDAVEGPRSPRKPFQLKITGSNFQNGVEVFVGVTDVPWPNVKRRGETQLVLRKGAALEALFPAGQPVQIRVVNPDGGLAQITFTRD